MSRPPIKLVKSGEPDALDIALQDAERRLAAVMQVDAMEAKRKAAAQRVYFLGLVEQGFTAKQALDLTKEYEP